MPIEILGTIRPGGFVGNQTSVLQGLKPILFFWGFVRVALKGHAPRTILGSGFASTNPETRGPGLTQAGVATRTLKPYRVCNVYGGAKPPPFRLFLPVHIQTRWTCL